jgi:NADPH-dependent curcumin reductase CurA
MSELTSREVRLAERPAATPTDATFTIATVEVPQPGPGEIQVRNLWMSVDPYMRGRMRALKSYIEPFEVGRVMSGECVGRVIASEHPEFAPGDYVRSMHGWREVWTAPPDGVARVDAELAPLSAYLGAMGMPGFTAYVGLLDIAELRPGETVFVSAAAGAVGSVVCQIAKLHDCRVIASAGSPAKIAWLRDELGVDAAFNYKEERSIASALARVAPDGIDVYYENVGGAHLEAALQHLNDFGRIAACGMIEYYNQRLPQCGPRNIIQIIAKRLTLRGFIVHDHTERRHADFERDMSRWIRDGTVQYRETVHEGIETAPRAFLGLFEGENIGKMLVRLADAEEAERPAERRAAE